MLTSIGCLGQENDTTRSDLDTDYYMRRMVMEIQLFDRAKYQRRLDSIRIHNLENLVNFSMELHASESRMCDSRLQNCEENLRQAAREKNKERLIFSIVIAIAILI